jgi:hypothetical protein
LENKYHRRTTLSRWRSRTRIPDAHWQPGRPALLSPVHRGRRAAQPRAPAQTSPDAGCRPLGFGPSARVPPSARPRVSWPPAPASGQRGRRGVLVVGSWPPPAGPPPRLPPSASPMRARSRKMRRYVLAGLDSIGRCVRLGVWPSGRVGLKPDGDGLGDY